MICMHCLVAFYEKEELHYLGNDPGGYWVVAKYVCPECKCMNLILLGGKSARFSGGNYYMGAPKFRSLKDIITKIPIRPRGSSRPPCPQEVPGEIAADYSEACLVLTDSSKASAALSRRCLQQVLRDAAGVTHGKLFKEIQEVIDSERLPSHIAEALHMVRHVGNFAAHPMKSERTGEIVAVDPQEAEWNLGVLEALFDFYYVQPAATAKRKAALNRKLEEAGKKPME